jgi:hypothetical protein
VCACFAVSSGPSEVSSFWIPDFIYVWNWNPENSNLILQNQRFIIRGKTTQCWKFPASLIILLVRETPFPELLGSLKHLYWGSGTMEMQELDPDKLQQVVAACKQDEKRGTLK